MPRPSLNSRVRDLVDLYLLIASGSLNASHDIPEELVPPPADWERPFQVLAEECRIEIGYREAFETLLGFWVEKKPMAFERQRHAQTSARNRR